MDSSIEIRKILHRSGIRLNSLEDQLAELIRKEIDDEIIASLLHMAKETKGQTIDDKDF